MHPLWHRSPRALYTLVRRALPVHIVPALLMLASMGAVSMLAGNLLALRQIYGKRLLGYSTVAHLGYMLAAFGLGMAFDSPETFAAGLLLLVSHAILKSLAFLAKGALHYYYDATLLVDLDGLAHRAPLASGLLILAVLGLAGLPPAPLFVAKLGLFWALPGLGGGGVIVMIALIVLGSLIGLGYYLPIVWRLLRQPAEPVQLQTHAHWIQVPILALGFRGSRGLWSTLRHAARMAHGRCCLCLCRIWHEHRISRLIVFIVVGLVLYRWAATRPRRHEGAKRQLACTRICAGRRAAVRALFSACPALYRSSHRRADLCC